MYLKKFEPFEKRIYLSSPTMHGDELKYITNAYETNWMTTIGESIDAIEESMKEMVGCKNAVALSSGTAALHMAMKLAGVKKDSVVLCSDVTFIASVNPAIYEGGIPVFVDSEYETWNMGPIALEKAFELYPQAKVVCCVHLYGTPAKMDEIRAICRKHGAVVIEDAAESLSSTYKGQQTGGLGDYSVVSYNGNKIITGSSGGVLLTDDFDAAEKVRKWSTQSREDAPWYQHEELGYNYRMSNVVASVVRGQLLYLEEHKAKKKAIYERYKEAFKDLPVTMNPYIENESEPNHWLSCILINADAVCHQQRDDNGVKYTPEKGKSCPTEILEALEKCNIEGRPVWKPMHTQPIFSKCDFVTQNGICKNTDEIASVGADIFNRGVCLPSDIKMTAEEQDRVIEIVKSCFE